MQGRILLVLVMLGSFPTHGFPQAPVPTESDSRSPPRSFVTRTIPAPDWLVWFSFYDMSMAYSRAASAGSHDARELVASKLGIDIKMAEQLLDLGNTYAQVIKKLMTEDQRVSDPGSKIRIEAAKISALQDHRAQLANLIEAEASVRLEHWLESEVRNRIRMVRIEPAPSTAR